MIIFCCRDVGPAKYLAELTNHFLPELMCLSSPMNSSLFKEKGAITISDIPNASGVKLVVTGTSLGDENESIDKKIVQWAKKEKIPCVSIVEHWSWYLKRFETKTKLILPDYIIVNDKLALEDATFEGLPKKIIMPLGNPYLEKLSKLEPVKKDVSTIISKYKLPEKKRLVFFISEELRDVFKNNSSDYLGYDEYEVLEAIKSQLGLTDHLVIKMHPEESIEKYKHIDGDQITLIKNCDINDIAISADIIVGMASMLLLELSIFRNDVISFRPNALKSFIGERLGVTVAAKNTLELTQVMKNKMRSQKTLRSIFDGSKERIIKFLSEVYV